MPTGKAPSYLADHRARLRDRFMQGGAAAMPDYELLELILFRAVPRQDMKPVARRLLDRFGDFNRVLSADPTQLTQIEGVGPAIVAELKIVEASAQRLARSRVINRPVLTSWDALLDYCHTTMAHGAIEQFRVLYLDRKNVLIADDEQLLPVVIPLGPGVLAAAKIRREARGDDKTGPQVDRGPFSANSQFAASAGVTPEIARTPRAIG